MNRKYEQRYRFAKWLGIRFAKYVKRNKNYLEIKTCRNIFGTENKSAIRCFQNTFKKAYIKEIGFLDDCGHLHDAELMQDECRFTKIYSNVFLYSTYGLSKLYKYKLEAYTNYQLEIDAYVKECKALKAKEKEVYAND